MFPNGSGGKLFIGCGMAVVVFIASHVLVEVLSMGELSHKLKLICSAFFFVGLTSTLIKMDSEGGGKSRGFWLALREDMASIGFVSYLLSFVFMFTVIAVMGAETLIAGSLIGRSFELGWFFPVVYGLSSSFISSLVMNVEELSA